MFFNQTQNNPFSKKDRPNEEKVSKEHDNSRLIELSKSCAKLAEENEKLKKGVENRDLA